MRLWHIPVAFLDRQRLQSQHYECEGLLTICANDKKWGSIADQFRHSCHYIVEIHDRCVIEMGLRAGLTEGIFRRHKTIITTKFLDPIYTSVEFVPSELDLKLDTIQLRDKWEREGYFFGVGTRDLRVLEREYGLPEGRPKKECLELQHSTRTLVKEHSDFLKSIKGDKRLGDKLDELFNHLGYDPLMRKKHAA